MAKYKNISGCDLHLVVPGFDALVPADGVVDIPEFQPDGVSPIEVGLGEGSRWEPVTDTKASKKAAE